MKKYFWWIGLIILSACAALVITSFYFNRILSMPTAPMANTIIPGEKILTSGIFSTINRGDIMVFKFPGDPRINYCMRVIGLPGELIQIQKQKVFINSQELPEKRVLGELNPLDDKAPIKEISTEGIGNYSVYFDKNSTDNDYLTHQMKFGVKEPYKIPANEYFVMGDSRDNSMDSRFWGTVKSSAMQYKAKKIVSSPDDSRFFTDLK